MRNKLLFLASFFFSIFLEAMDKQQVQARSRDLPIRDISSDTLSRSPGEWFALEVRKDQALLEQKENTGKIQAADAVTFIAAQSLELIDQIKEKLCASRGDSIIDEQLNEMLSSLDGQEDEQQVTPSCCSSLKSRKADLFLEKIQKDPELNSEIKRMIINQSLLVNKIIRSLETK